MASEPADPQALGHSIDFLRRYEPFQGSDRGWSILLNNAPDFLQTHLCKVMHNDISERRDLPPWNTGVFDRTARF